jgi:hypothetical protein
MSAGGEENEYVSDEGEESECVCVEKERRASVCVWRRRGGEWVCVSRVEEESKWEFGGGEESACV